MPGSWSERGSVAVDAGDLQLAKQCFARAVKDECANGRHRFHLAVVLEGLGASPKQALRSRQTGRRVTGLGCRQTEARGKDPRREG